LYPRFGAEVAILIEVHCQGREGNPNGLVLARVARDADDVITGELGVNEGHRLRKSDLQEMDIAALATGSVDYFSMRF